MVADQKIFLERAEEARVIAEDMKSPEAKRMMLGIANEYEEMAQWILERGDTGSSKRTTGDGQRSQ